MLRHIKLHKLAQAEYVMPLVNTNVKAPQQCPCLKQLWLLFLHNEGTICQFHKLAWAGLAIPISEVQYPSSKKSSMIMAPTSWSWSRKAMIPEALLVKSGVSVILHHISGLITMNVLSIQKGRGTLQL